MTEHPSQILFRTAANYATYGTPYPERIRTLERIVARVKTLDIQDPELVELLANLDSLANLDNSDRKAP